MFDVRNKRLEERNNRLPSFELKIRSLVVLNICSAASNKIQPELFMAYSCVRYFFIVVYKETESL